MDIWDALVAFGALATLIGIAALIWCVVTVARARRRGDEAALRATLTRVVAVNMAALLASTLGLMLVITGLFLGG